MSTQRFDIQHAPAPRESFRLLYIDVYKRQRKLTVYSWNGTACTVTLPSA